MRATARRNRADVRIKAMPMRCDARAASRHMGPMISDTAWLESAGKRNFGQLPLILLQLVLATTQSVGLRTSAVGTSVAAGVPTQKLIAREGP